MEEIKRNCRRKNERHFDTKLTIQQSHVNDEGKWQERTHGWKADGCEECWGGNKEPKRGSKTRDRKKGCKEGRRPRGWSRHAGVRLPVNYFYRSYSRDSDVTAHNDVPRRANTTHWASRPHCMTFSTSDRVGFESEPRCHISLADARKAIASCHSLLWECVCNARSTTVAKGAYTQFRNPTKRVGHARSSAVTMLVNDVRFTQNGTTKTHAQKYAVKATHKAVSIISSYHAQNAFSFLSQCVCRTHESLLQ